MSRGAPLKSVGKFCESSKSKMADFGHTGNKFKDTGNFIEHVWKKIPFYVYFVPFTFFIQFTVWDNEVFWFFELFFWNCNKTILVEDTFNLITHSRKEMKLCIFFIRDTFLIWFTVYEIFRVLWENGCTKKTRPIL